MSLTYSIFIDWDGDGFASGALDDITEYVADWSETIGITDSRARVADVGTLSITVRNETMLFSPAYSSGALFGKLLPGLAVRVQMTDGVTTWPIFRGITRAILPVSGKYSARTATIECADFLQVLQDQAISLPLQEDKNMSYLLKLIGSATWRSARATGTVTFAGLPADNDTFTVNGTTYRFKTAIAAINDILIGATIEATVDNAVAAVNGGAGSGTVYYAGTARVEGVTAEPQPTYYRAVAADAPVRYYRLGEAAGTTAYDSGANGANATYVNTPTLGAAGALANDPDAAVTLNGTDEYITVPYVSLDNRSFSIEFWMKPAASPPAAQIPFSVGTVDVANERLFFYLKDDGQLIFSFFADDLASAVGAITFGAGYYHIVGTYYAASDTAELYINGALIDTNNAGPLTISDEVMYIGVYNLTADEFKGSIDEFAIHWTPLTASRVAAHYAARAVAPGILLSANARGAWGNALTLAESGANIAVSDSVFAGGVDGPAGLFAYEDGRQTFDVAGDLWSSGETNGLDAVTDVMVSEYGLFWQARDGTLTAKDRDYEFEQHAATAALTLSSQHNALEWVDDFEMLWNRVVVSFTPRGELTNGVVARAKSIITVPARSGNDRWNPSSDIDKSGFISPDAGLFVSTLPYVDTAGGGKLIGAKSLTLPLVPNTDYTIGDKSDGTNSSSNYDYTTGISLTFSVAATGSGVEVSIKNTAIGNLYVANMQVRGTGLIAYDTQDAIVEDATSMDAYGRRAETIDLPLTSSSAFAYALATYLLSRHKTPVPRVASLAFAGATSVGAVNLFSIDIGEVLVVTDAQTGVTSQRYLVTGMEYGVKGGNPFTTRITLHVRRLDDAPYLIWDDATHGKWDTGTWAL